jgi:hypothetical protein
LGIRAGGAPGVDDQEQREEAADLPLGRHEFSQHTGQAQGTPDQVHTHQSPPGRRRVPGGVQQVDDREDGIKALRQLARPRDKVGDAGRGDLFLGSGQTRRHRRLGDEEGLRDVGGAHAADEAQGEHDLGLPRERRVAASEDQSQPVVGDRAAFYGVYHGGIVHVSLVGFVRLYEQGQLGAERLPAPQRVQCLASGRGGEPGSWPRGNTVTLPGVQRRYVRLLDALLGQVEVPGNAHRRGEHEGPLVAMRVRHGAFDGGGPAHPKSGLTSTPPRRVAGESWAISSAWSRSRASITVNPPRTSLDSTNGPSVTTSPRIEVAVVLGCSACPLTIVPPSFSICAAYRLCASSSSDGISIQSAGVGA